MEHLSHLLPELAEAMSLGFTDHYSLLQNGFIFCLRTKTTHEFWSANFVPCRMMPATLLLVTLANGMKGTALDFGEHY